MPKISLIVVFSLLFRVADAEDLYTAAPTLATTTYSTKIEEAEELTLVQDDTITEAPSSFSTSYSSASEMMETEEVDQDGTSTSTTVTDECDETEKAFAPVCCPLKNDIFAKFCEKVVGRSRQYSSTGSIQVQVQHDATSISPPQNNEDSETIAHHHLRQLEDATVSPSTNVDPTYDYEQTASPTESTRTDNPSSTGAPTSKPITEAPTETRECDEMEKAFAPDCCPITDASFEEFCKSLFSRSHYTSTGMIEMHQPWIGSYGIAGSPNGRRQK